MNLSEYTSNRPHGFKVQLAKKLGVSKSFLSQMISGRVSVPIYVAKKMEEISEGKVTKAELRPDIWD